MKVDKEVTIYVESFIDAAEIVDNMDTLLMNTAIFMDPDEFDNGKCYIVICNTMFIFFPVHRLIKEYDETKTKLDAHERCEECRYFYMKISENPCWSCCVGKHNNFKAEEDNDENFSDKIIDHSNIDNIDS